MSTSSWILIYLSILAVDLFAVYSGNETIRYASKSLLMPLLIVYFIFGTKAYASSLTKWIILALLFSWAGDVLLMFEVLHGNFFIFGLVSFLVAHVFYIIFFERILKIENTGRNYWLFIPVAIYYVTLIYLLTPYLGEMKLPVWIYGAVISCMFIQALQAGRIKNRGAAWLMVTGTCLFIISDSVLAINKFYTNIENADIFIMLSYGVAQLMISLGAARYIRSVSTHKFAGKNFCSAKRIVMGDNAENDDGIAKARYIK